MFVANVIGQVISTIKHPAYRATKLLIVQPVRPDGAADGPSVVAVDTAGVGIGERVLVVREGKAAMEILKVKNAPVRSLIVGVVDSMMTVHDTGE